jgi:hypothetical protein
MKKLPALLLVLACTTFLTACNKGQEINGHTMQTAYRSVKGLKNRLAPESRVEFEVSFWTIRDSIKSEGDFLNAVGGKTPLEIIEMGKEVYQQRKSSGFKGYEQYSSWEDMIAKFGKERSDQENRKGSAKSKETSKDKANDVLYKL